MEKILLEHNNYKVRVALDGSEALDILGKETIDLILLDLKLNWVEGDIVAQLVKRYKKTKDIPVIVVTGLSREEVEKYQIDGVEAVLYKPVDPRSLLETIKEFLLRTT
mgnify:CR=1 FL=1